MVAISNASASSVQRTNPATTAEKYGTVLTVGRHGDGKRRDGVWRGDDQSTSRAGWRLSSGTKTSASELETASDTASELRQSSELRRTASVTAAGINVLSAASSSASSNVTTQEMSREFDTLLVGRCRYNVKFRLPNCLHRQSASNSTGTRKLPSLASITSQCIAG